MLSVQNTDGEHKSFDKRMLPFKIAQIFCCLKSYAGIFWDVLLSYGAGRSKEESVFLISQTTYLLHVWETGLEHNESY